MTYDQLGSWLHPDAVSEQRDLNFLHPNAHEHAEQRSRQVQDEGGSLEPKRLFHNMLSSMPMCFNLFGAMRGEDEFLLLFQRLFDARATAIVDIVCEWTPPDRNGQLGDRTAFDAVVLYETAGGPAFCGIETKYTEPFSQKIYEPSRYNHYREVTHESGWFAAPTADIEVLQSPSANQLWRNTMLAARLDQHQSHGRGSLAVVALAGDPGVRKARDIVSPTLSESHADRLHYVTLEDILEVTEQLAPELAWWATSFRRRYIDFTLPHLPADVAGRDPLGPVMGRSIVDTAALARPTG
ncbi:hypothetical protein P0Y31_18245 [Knoellia sp. 3-2P3]|nr:hypothetical protein [Knoellia sp. 3-2P3]MDF2094289.1 hypothetical protein [Knoellia sp. 3-2P3]